jgi:hypothetical protein
VEIANAPLQLREYAVTEVTYRRRAEGGSAPDSALTMRFEMEGARTGEDGAVLALRVWFNEADEDTAERTSESSPSPHTGHIEVRGGFQWIGDDVPERDRLIVVNGLSVLYGIARVYVAQASGSGPDARLLLPSVSFHEVELDLSVRAEAE